MQVYVPTVEEAATRPSVGNALGHSAEQGVPGESLININTADVVALQTLNGIGEAKAEAILSHRENNGLFNSIEDIKNVSGIGEKLYERIKENITVD
jgi:competence protein ComEA helix-hairpin-helix repeat region